MPKVGSKTSVCHHVSVLTREHDRLVSFLTDVLDFKVCYSLKVPSSVLAELMGWVLVAPTVRSTLLGDGEAGMVEIVDLADLPKSANDNPREPSSGPFQICLNVDDLHSTLERATGADEIIGPIELGIGGSTILAGIVSVAGTRFQLTQAGSS